MEKEHYYDAHWIQRGEQGLVFTVEGIPYEIGIDPRHYLIDGVLENNKILVDMKF